MCGVWIIRPIFSSVRDDEWLSGKWPINRPELYIIIKLRGCAITIKWWWVSTGGGGGSFAFHPWFHFYRLTLSSVRFHVISVNKGVRTVFHFLLFDQYIAHPRVGYPQLQTLRPVDEWRGSHGNGLSWLEAVVGSFASPPAVLWLFEKWKRNGVIAQVLTPTAEHWSLAL